MATYKLGCTLFLLSLAVHSAYAEDQSPATTPASSLSNIFEKLGDAIKNGVKLNASQQPAQGASQAPQPPDQSSNANGASSIAAQMQEAANNSIKRRYQNVDRTIGSMPTGNFLFKCLDKHPDLTAETASEGCKEEAIDHGHPEWLDPQWRKARGYDYKVKKW